MMNVYTSKNTSCSYYIQRHVCSVNRPLRAFFKILRLYTLRNFHIKNVQFTKNNLAFLQNRLDCMQRFAYTITYWLARSRMRPSFYQYMAIGDEMIRIVDQKNKNALEFNKVIAPTINEISAPLRPIGVKHFGYVRIYNNSTLLRLSDNASWSQKYFEHHFYNDGDLYETGHIPENELHYKILSGTPSRDHYSALYEHGFWQALVMYKKKKTYCDKWFFASSCDNESMIGRYINNIDFFKEFALYFYNKAYDVINHSDEDSLIHTNMRDGLSPPASDTNLLDTFREALSLNKYRVGPDLFFSKREIECIMGFLRGETKKESGLRLGIADRTVEHHLNAVKHKLNCNASKLRDMFYRGSAQEHVNELFNLL